MPAAWGRLFFSGGSIASTAAARFGTEAAGRGLQFLLVYLAQRLLGPALYGHFTFATAIGLMAAVATDLGMPLIVTREAARRAADVRAIAGAALTMKFAASVAAVAAIGAIARLRPPEVQAATAAFSLAILIASFVEFAGFVLRGLGRVHEETVLLFTLRLLTVAAGTMALVAGGSLNAFAVAWLGSAVAGLAVAGWWLVKRIGRPALRVDSAAIATIVRPALTLGGATILSAAYTRTPIFVLDRLLGPAAAGVYGVAQKLIEPLALLPASVMAAAFAPWSRSQARPAAAHAPRRMIVLLATAGAVIAALAAVGAPRLIDAMYGADYRDAVRALQVLALAAVPVFVNYALTHLLVAGDRQRLNLHFNAIVFAFNFALAVVLVPAGGVAGAAAATLASELLLLMLCWRALRAAPPRAVQGTPS